jgi:hypothetical protein
MLGRKPSVEARLDLETLDVNPDLGTAGKPSASGFRWWQTRRLVHR